MSDILSSETVHREIDELLLLGRATTASEAEQMWLDSHLPDIAFLGLVLEEQEFVKHEAVKLLMSHGSRPFEDEL